MSDVPNGFALHARQSPAIQSWQPIYAKVTESSYRLGCWIGQAHCNSRGFLHGGVIATLADNAMGLTYGLGLGSPDGIVTLKLDVDYLASGRMDDWLEIRPCLIRGGKTIGFVDADVFSEDLRIARASAIFRTIRANS
ncbi:MAG: PaaI family thioesterase [Pseudomonadota bacterium]